MKRFGETGELLVEEAGKVGGEVGLLEAVLGWLEEDLRERGPRNVVPSVHKAYADLEKIE